MTTSSAIPQVPPDELPRCHARGASPEGYDGMDATCQGCIDKFTCLPAAAGMPKIWASRGARAWRVEDDAEVTAVISGRMSYEDAVERMVERARLLELGRRVPAELLVRPSEGAFELAAEEAGEEEEEVEVPTKPKKKPAKPKKPKKKSAKPTKKPSKLAKPAKKAKAKVKPAKKSFAVSASEAGHRAAGKAEHPIARNGKLLPLPRSLSPEEMTASMARIKLGKAIDFEVGMVIVRKTKGGEHRVQLVATGYRYSGDGAVYPSLSAVAMIASGTPNRSGNDYYNLVTSGSTSVESAKGKVIAKYGS